MGRLKRFAIGASTATVVLGGLTAVWYQTHYVVPVEPERTVPLPSPNGFDTLQAALKLEVKELGGVFVSPRPLNDDPPYRYPTPPLPERLKLLAANQASIHKTREALKQEYITPTPQERDIDFPRYAMFREQARMLNFAARTYAEAGNVSEAMNCSLDGIEMGVKIPRGATVTPALVGIACEAIAQKPAWTVADKLDAQTARAAALRLGKIDEQRWPLVEAMELDRQLTQRTSITLLRGGPKATWEASEIWFKSPEDLPQADSDTADGVEEDRKPSAKEKAQLLWTRAQMVYYGPRTVMDNSAKWMNSVREYARHPWGSKRPPIIEPGDPLSKAMVLPFPLAEFKDLHIQAHSRLLQTYLALHAYQLEHGRYPESLNTLVTAGYLKAVPIDPFSPTHAPLGYKPDGTLWSVGPDAKNDGGKPIDMEDKRGYVTVEKTGDIVARINTW